MRKVTLGDVSYLHPSEDPRDSEPHFHNTDENDPSKANSPHFAQNELPMGVLKHEKEYESTDNESKMFKVSSDL